MIRLRWRWRRWRAAHYLWAAEQNYWRWPTEHNELVAELASRNLREIDAARP